MRHGISFWTTGYDNFESTLPHVNQALPRRNAPTNEQHKPPNMVDAIANNYVPTIVSFMLHEMFEGGKCRSHT